MPNIDALPMVHYTRLPAQNQGRRSQVVRQRSAKPLFAGSIPAVASNSSPMIKFPAPPNFNFESTVVSHGWYLLAPFRWSAEERVLRRVEILGNHPVELAILFSGSALAVNGGKESKELHTKVGRMFQFGVDTAEFVALARNSPPHAWVERAGFGRLLCGATLFEDVAKIIATTNTMWSQTKRMVQLLVEKCGRGGAFPEPADVARHTP